MSYVGGGNKVIRLCILGDGESIHTRKWVNFFSKLDYKICLISMRDTDYQYGENVEFNYVKPPFNNKLSYFLLINKVKDIIMKFKPDLLHSHYATSYGLLGKMSSFKPFVISAWGSDIYEFPNQSSLNKWLLINILKSADAICSTSKDMAEEIKKYYNKDILITPFGVDLEVFKCSVPLLNKDYITIGITKNLEKVYGINYLIEAFYELCKERKSDDLRLLIVGDGSERENLEKLCIERELLDKVTFTGNVDNNEIPKFINSMDIVCIPSLSESFGVAGVEAGACGRPVIASKVGGLKEVIVHGYNGYLVEPGSVEDIKEKLILILENKDKLLEMGKNSRDYMKEKYDWNENASIVKSLYEKLIES